MADLSYSLFSEAVNEVRASWLNWLADRDRRQRSNIIDTSSFNSESNDAEQRADNLLRQLLTDEEYENLHRSGELIVRSSMIPSREYHIPLSGRRMVRVYESSKLVQYLCVQPYYYLPNADRILMHKLLIEGDEQRYLEVANKWSTPRGITLISNWLQPPRPRLVVSWNETSREV